MRRAFEEVTAGEAPRGLGELPDNRRHLTHANRQIVRIDSDGPDSCASLIDLRPDRMRLCIAQNSRVVACNHGFCRQDDGGCKQTPYS
jgi:hypothetical protein